MVFNVYLKFALAKNFDNAKNAYSEFIWQDVATVYY